MFYCPNCDQALLKTRNAHGVHWACPACEGRAVSLALLRSSHGEKKVQQLLRATANPGIVSGKPCPICRLKTREVQADDGFTVDVCRPCNFVWFDWQEIELPLKDDRPIKIPQPEAHQRVREHLANEEVKRANREANAFDMELTDWRSLPAIFGMPVEVDRDELRQRPLATWSIAAAVAIVSMTAFVNLDAAVEHLGLVPSEIWRSGGLTVLTSFFVHAGWMHLLGNLYFFVTFGDNVEDYLGHKRFALLLVSATITGSVLHILLNPSSDVPCVGASGGISGLIAFYAFKFPEARLGWLFRMGLYFRWVRIPAWGWFGFWILFQCLGLLLQMSGLSRVSAAAHLGGVLAGVGFWALWRRNDPAS